MVNLRRNVTWLGFASNKLLPSLSTLADDISGVSATSLGLVKGNIAINLLPVLALSSESELVLWFSIWDLVDTEPFIGGSQ